MSATSLALRVRYPYEEFADHLKAMRLVRQWEDTSRFGHLGMDQSSRAHIARVLEYFSDSFADPKEAVGKAELYLTICDFLGRHSSFFARKGLLESDVEGQLSVEPALLRAVHWSFTEAAQAVNTDPKKIVSLARALKAMEG